MNLRSLAGYVCLVVTISCSGGGGGSSGGGSAAFSGPFTRIRSNASGLQICAVNTSGGAGCLGHNNYSQLGNGSTTDSISLQAVTGLSSGVADIAVGGYHGCAVTTTGTVKCWGDNDYGALGNGTTTTSKTPVDVSSLTSVSQVVVGEYHSCALTTAGAVHCWGSNTFGQVGNNSATAASTPQQVTGLTSGVSRLTASTNVTCALMTDTSVKCWGALGSIQWQALGAINASIPLEVSAAGVGAKAVTVGAEHICLIDSSEAVKCMGGNGYGQLGTGNETTATSFQAATVLTSGVKGIVATVFSTCARTTSAVYCWGTNGKSQLGNGSSPSKTSTPTQISSFSGTPSLLVGGYNFMLALLADGTVSSWGSNLYGTLATGKTATEQDTPSAPVTATLLTWSTSGGMVE